MKSCTDEEEERKRKRKPSKKKKHQSSSKKRYLLASLSISSLAVLQTKAGRGQGTRPVLVREAGYTLTHSLSLTLSFTGTKSPRIMDLRNTRSTKNTSRMKRKVDILETQTDQRICSHIRTTLLLPYALNVFAELINVCSLQLSVCVYEGVWWCPGSSLIPSSPLCAW